MHQGGGGGVACAARRGRRLNRYHYTGISYLVASLHSRTAADVGFFINLFDCVSVSMEEEAGEHRVVMYAHFRVNSGEIFNQRKSRDVDGGEVRIGDGVYIRIWAILCDCNNKNVRVGVVAVVEVRAFAWAIVGVQQKRRGGGGEGGGGSEEGLDVGVGVGVGVRVGVKVLRNRPQVSKKNYLHATAVGATVYYGRVRSW